MLRHAARRIQQVARASGPKSILNQQSNFSSPEDFRIPLDRAYASLRFRPREAALRPLGTDATAVDFNVPFREQPQSLALDVGAIKEPRIDRTPPPGLGGWALRALGYYSDEAKMIRGARRLYGAIVERAEDEKLYQALSLEKKFRTVYALLVVHVWLALVRLRAEGKAGGEVGQMVYDLFNHDCEKRVAAAGVKVLISKWMRELEKNFYGACGAYDKACGATATTNELPEALWRNIFAEDDSEMPSGEGAAQVQALTRYLRRELASLAMTDSDSFMNGSIKFSNDYGQ